MRLDRPVHHLAQHVRHRDLDHGDLGARHLVADRVHHVGGLEHQEARLLDADARLGDALQRHRLLGDRLAEGDARLDAPAHRLEHALGQADGAHAVMDASRAETALRDLEAASLAEENVRHGHTHILEQHLAMAMRRIVEAEDRQRAQQLHAGRIHRHQDHRLPPIAIGVSRVGLAHEDDDLAAPIGRTGGPPFAAVDDVMVALALDRAGDVGGVGRGYARLGHGEA